MDYGQIDDIRGHLEILKNDDIMIQLEGINMLKSHLAISNQDSLGEFPLEEYSKRLIEMLGMPNDMGMDVIIDIKYAAMQCLYSLVDIYPQHVNNMIAKGYITNVCSSMEYMIQLFDNIFLEQCIRTFDKVSQENPHSILRSKAIPLCLGCIDFFDSRSQERILNFLTNCCGAAQSEDEFDQYLLDLVPQLCPMLEIHSENDVVRAQKISTVFQRMVRSFTMFYYSYRDFDKIAALYQKFSDRGAISCIAEGLKRYAQVMQEQKILGEAGENSMEVDMINTQQVQGQIKHFSDETLSNFFKILTSACKYQITTIQAIINDDTISMLENLLPGEDQEQPSYMQDMTSLINQIFPATDELIHDRNQVFIFGPGQNYQVSEDPNSQYQLIKKSTIELEKKKSGIFEKLNREFYTFCASKILPKFLLGYRKNISLQFRVSCLSIIDKILAICPDDIVQNQIEALPLAQFVLQIFQNGRSQQVLLCLRMITRVLKSNSLKFALPFVREGVQQAVQEFTDIEKLFKYEKEDPMPYEMPPTLCPCGKPGCTYGQPPGQQNIFGEGMSYQSSYAKTLFNNKDEKSRVKQKVEQLEAILKQESIKIPESERANIQKVLKQHVDTLKLLEEKDLFEKFMEAKMKKKQEKQEQAKEGEAQVAETEEKKDAQGNAEAPELAKKKSEVPKITELIMNEAQQLQKQYFQNDVFLSQMTNTYAAEMNLMARFKNLADALTDAACSTTFDCEITQNLMTEFTDIITGPMGITSFEFQTSGLLQALEIFLTKSLSQADFEQKLKQQGKQEEMKHSQELELSQVQKKAFQEITQEDAKCLILRLKVFAHSLCHVKAKKLPFKELIDQCHEILSKKEAIIFDETTSERPQNSVEAIRQLNKNVVINLVFDGDMKQITKTIEETEELAREQPELKSQDKEMKEEEDEIMKLEEPQLISKAKSLALPFAKIGERVSDEAEKSQVYTKRYDLFNQLKQVPLNIQQSDNIWLLEDFLLKRIKTSEDVRKLVMHTRPGERFSGLFGRDEPSEQVKEQQLTEFEDIDNPELQELHRRCVDRIGELLDEAESHSKFEELKPELIEELTQEISVTVVDTEVTEAQLKLFFQALIFLTEAMIKDHQLGEGEDAMEDLSHEQTQQQIIELIIMKKHSFIGMIETLQQRTKDQINVLKAELSNNPAEEKKQAPKQGEQEESKDAKPTDEQMDLSGEGEQKTKLKVQEPVPPAQPGDSPVLSVSLSEKGEEAKPPTVVEHQESKPAEKEASKPVEDVEMKEETTPPLKKEEIKQEEVPEVPPQIVSEKEKREQEKAKLMQKMNEQIEARNKAEKMRQAQHAGAQILQDFKETTSGNKIVEGELEELIRQNNGEDIEIEFFCLGKKIELNTSVFELVQQSRERANKQNQRLVSGQVPSKQKKEQEEMDPKNPNSVLQTLMASFSRKEQERDRFGFPSTALTIYFTIKDKVSVQRSARKDSFFEFTQKRERTMSQHVETISAKSLNHIVQQLIETEFAVFKNYTPKVKSKPEAKGDNTKEETAQREALKAKQEDVDRRLVEQSLKILKVLHYLYTNIHLFTTDGINYLLMKYKNGDELDKLQFNDQEMTLALQSDIEESLFHHTKLDANMLKQIQDPYKLVSSGLSDILKQIFSSCAFLFPYETKMLYFKLVSFIGVDINRSLYFLKNYMEVKKKSGKGLGAAQFQLMFGQEKEEKSRIGHQKVKVERQRLLESGLQIIDKLQKRSLLEIEYKDEVGHGLGPTLEFYTLIAQAIVKESEGTLWRKDVKDNCLFPKPLDIRKITSEEAKRIGDIFRMAGTFVAKSIVDDRLIELPISPLMWKILLGKKTNMFDLKYLEKDPYIFNTISMLQRAANRIREVEEQNLDPESKKARLERIMEEDNGIYNVEAMCFAFTLPGTGDYDDQGNVKTPPIELIQNGAKTDVTLENVQEYIDLVLQAIFHDTVNLQIQSFRKGFNAVLPIESLRVFQVDEEIEMLVCGKEPDDDQWNQWTEPSTLRELVKPNHGYSSSSRCYLDFIKFVNQLKKGEREKFILWTTGSRRLRLGGFTSLDPPMSLYRNTVSDTFLPSVNTCLHYVKMPEYESFEILKQKFDQAIQEGSNYFAFD